MGVNCLRKGHSLTVRGTVIDEKVLLRALVVLADGAQEVDIACKHLIDTQGISAKTNQLVCLLHMKTDEDIFTTLRIR